LGENPEAEKFARDRPSRKYALHRNIRPIRAIDGGGVGG
jgi:hypothetical protein